MLRGKKAWRRWAAVLGLLAAGADGANGSTPRWVTGPPYFSTVYQPVIWYTDQPLYFTDPGDLSASVNHAAADAMVAAAAGVWNVPTSRLVLSQGGTLHEQVSGANVYAGQNGLVFPADVQSGSYAAMQIAVVYDRDGSVTDLLLGSGASDPSGCRQNAVTESVDGIVPAGYIQHAIVVLNGRCTGPAKEQQLQMQYQLERVFGRVLGLGWSQLNDNVFTGTPQPTYQQTLHWPIMHPIDLICGPYAYQCLPQPFTLRADDVASITQLYPVTSSPGPGKQLSYAQASIVEGSLFFPTQEGMKGVNLILRRNPVPEQVWETWDEVSAVSGVLHQQLSGNPVTPKPTGVEGSLGALLSNGDLAQSFRFGWIPLADGQTGQDVLIHGEAINPLYTGEYAVGPYTSSTVTPSGGPATLRVNYVTPGTDLGFAVYAPGAASSCQTSPDGTQSQPQTVAAGGWWTGTLCGTTNSNPYYFGHTSWISLPVRGNRSLTVEVTAQDESGAATANKARPVMGVWSTADALGSPPSAGAAAVAFNSIVNGMTTLGVQSTQPQTYRVAISEERGDGRPDYGYQARVLYADTILPVTNGAGAQVTISGMGFRAGNAVTVNGVAAKVSSWTATTIVATVPLLKSVQPGTTVPVDVVVRDASTNGTTTMTGAFAYQYTAPVYTLTVVSAPAGAQPVGLAAGPALAVRAFDTDGTTPLAGVPVVFAATAGSVAWGGCGAAPSCTVVTDASGLAVTVVTPLLVGPVVLQAATLGLTDTISFQAVALVRSVAVTPQVVYLAAGVPVQWPVVASALQQGAPVAGTPVTWSVVSGAMTFLSADGMTGPVGTAQAVVTAGPLTGGAQATGTACAWTTVCGGFAAQGVDAAEFFVAPVTSGSLAPMSFQITDAVGNPVAGAAVTIHQAVRQWTAPCPMQGRCPVAPVYQTALVVGTSDLGGMVTVTPLDAGGAEVTQVAVASGAAGFVALTVERVP